MESYNNYQDIINAIKAEYVIVRDLKRVANAKKRELNNAHSFVNRKGNEENSLDMRLEESKNSALDRADNAITNIQSSINNSYKNTLSSSKAKLATIDAEIEKLTVFHSISPTAFAGFSDNEIQSINSLKNVLSSAISDVDFIYENDIMQSYKWSVLKDETLISLDTHHQNEIEAHYDTVVWNVKQLLSSTKNLVDNYIGDADVLESEIIACKDQLVYDTKKLVEFKSELADLLDSNASQSLIDSKETEIANQKSVILLKAEELKRREIELESFYQYKHKSFSVYFEIIEDLKQEADNWVAAADAQTFIIYSRGDWGRDIQKSVRDFVDSLFYSMIGKVSSTSTGSWLFNTVRDIFNETSHRLKNADRASINAYRRRQVACNIMNYVHDDNKGRAMLDHTVPLEVYNDVLHMAQELLRKSEEYIYARREQPKRYASFMNKWSRFQDEYNQAIDQFIPKYCQALEEHLFSMDEQISFNEGRWTGTSEQENSYYSLLQSKRGKQVEVELADKKLQYAKLRFQMASEIFSDFYSGYLPLRTSYEGAVDSLNAAQTEINALHSAWQTAYDYLQTLTQGTPEYDAAEADMNAKQLALTTYENDVRNPATTAANEAYDALNTWVNENGGSVDFDFGWDISGTTLISWYMEQYDWQNELNQKVSEREVINSDIEAIKLEMTFAPAPLEDKIKAKGNIDATLQRNHKVSQYWGTFYGSHFNFLQNIKSMLVSSFSSLVGYDPQSSIDSALDQLTNYLTNNTYLSMLGDEMDYSQRDLDMSFAREELGKAMVTSVFNIDQNDFGNYFNPNEAGTSQFKQNPTFLSNKIKQTAQNFRGHANGGFADIVIEYVNTGVANF